MEVRAEASGSLLAGPPMTFASAIAYLDGLRSPVARPGLERMERLLAALDVRLDALPIVHVTGTNGKGSVSRMIEAALASMGMRTCLYTSPHLEHVSERIVIDGSPISETSICRLAVPIGEAIGTLGASMRPTHFEALTALGLLAFSATSPDVVVLEAGVGGRLDATNVATGQVAVVTNVELDHTEVLGSTLEAVAREKAGIIKADAIAVIGEARPGPASVILERCDTVGATPWRLGTEVVLRSDVATERGRCIDLTTPFGAIDALEVPLFGHHQAVNAALAVAAVEAFTGAPVDRRALADGWHDLVNPGRFEIVEGEPTIVIDVAHNPHGVAALMATLDEQFPDRPRIVVVGVNPHKDAEEMLSALQRDARAVVTTEVADAPAVPAHTLGKIATYLGYPTVRVEPDPAGALAAAVAMAAPDDVIVLTGSHYWIGEIRHLLVHRDGA